VTMPLGCRRIDAGEQIAEGPPSAQGEPDAAAMLGSVVEQMAPLAERLDVAVSPPAMARVVVEMRRRQHQLGHPHRHSLGQGRAGDLAATPGATDLLGLVPPAAIPRWLTTWPCGRPQVSQRPWARTKRTQRLTCGQSIG
jgi:hypothetical protein